MQSWSSKVLEVCFCFKQLLKFFSTGRSDHCPSLYVQYIVCKLNFSTSFTVPAALDISMTKNQVIFQCKNPDNPFPRKMSFKVQHVLCNRIWIFQRQYIFLWNGIVRTQGNQRNEKYNVLKSGILPSSCKARLANSLRKTVQHH